MIKYHQQMVGLQMAFVTHKSHKFQNYATNVSLQVFVTLLF